MAFNANFNPMQVSLPGQGNKPGGVWGGDPIRSNQGPYLGGGNQPKPPNSPWGGQPPQAPKSPFLGGLPSPSPTTGGQVIQQPQQQGVLGAQAVRATGQGPYDPAFRQDLATYAGGQFARPGGNLSLNPTGTDTSQLGANNSLLAQALGGQAFQFAPPTPAQPPSKPTKKVGRTRNPDDFAGRQFGMMR